LRAVADNVAVEILDSETVSTGGIILPGKNGRTQKLVARVISAGENVTHLINVGEYVIIRIASGTAFRDDTTEYRRLPYKDIEFVTDDLEQARKFRQI